jgi:hypothetical protein
LSKLPLSYSFRFSGTKSAHLEFPPLSYLLKEELRHDTIKVTVGSEKTLEAKGHGKAA